MTPYETYNKAVAECLCSLCKTKQGDCDFELCSAYSEIPKLRSLTLALLDGEISRKTKLLKDNNGYSDDHALGKDWIIEKDLSHLRSERELIANHK